MAALRDRIKEEIRRRGKITFNRFMELTLYEPELGYYNSSRTRVGAEGDFFTAPATHPVFAALLALQLEQMWRLLDCPTDFTIVEMGAGKGLLARDIINYLPNISASLAQSLKYYTVEKDAVSLYHGTSARETSVRTLPDSICGCFLSNELLDAFPVHRVLMRNGHLQEIYVTVSDDEFVEVPGVPSTQELEEYFQRENITLPESYCTEVNLNISLLMREIAERLQRGFAITIDYGYPAAQLYAPQRNGGTLMTYHHHTCGSDPYSRIGSQDITSHVDFTAAVMAGERKGLQCRALFSQREFLTNLGIHAFLDALRDRGLGYPDYLANRYAMLELIRKEGMGNFAVLLQSKNTAAATLYGMSPDNELQEMLRSGKKSLSVPLLDEKHVPLLQGKYPHYHGISDDLW